MCTVRVVPPASMIGWPARISDWFPALPLIENAVGLPTLVSIAQVTGVRVFPPGRASLRVTPVAVPWPGFATVTVTPIVAPADTADVWSAVLVTMIAAQSTVSDADAWSE